MICEILGVPEGDRQQIRHWIDDMLHREPGQVEPTQKGMEAGLNTVLYVLDLAKEKRKHPTPDMLSGLVDAGLSDEEIAGFGVLVAGAGSETVTKLVGGGVVLFDRNPGEWDKVLADPAGALPGAIEEILRYWAPSQYQGRRSTEASEWHGVTIPDDEPVLLLTGAANRDQRAYDDPDRFDIGRPPKLSVGLRSRDPQLPRRRARAAREPRRVRGDREALARVLGERGRPPPGPDVQRRRLQQRPRHRPRPSPTGFWRHLRHA